MMTMYFVQSCLLLLSPISPEIAEKKKMSDKFVEEPLKVDSQRTEKKQKVPYCKFW